MTAEGPRFGATPQNPDLLRWIGIQVVLLVIAWVIGMVVRRLLASPMTMSTASATLTGLGGLWGGLLVAGWIFSSSDMWRPAMIGVAAAVALVVVVIVSLIVAYLHPRPGLDPIAEVAKRGESDSLEFKSSARWNMRAGKRDDAMETVIAKTVAAFMNSGGGTLLIGVTTTGDSSGWAPTTRPSRHRTPTASSCGSATCGASAWGPTRPRCPSSTSPRPRTPRRATSARRCAG